MGCKLLCLVMLATTLLRFPAGWRMQVSLCDIHNAHLGLRIANGGTRASSGPWAAKVTLACNLSSFHQWHLQGVHV